MKCSCGEKMVLVGQIRGGGRMYFCLVCCEICIKDKYDKLITTYQMTWFIKWHKEKISKEDRTANLVSEMLGIKE